MSGTLKIGWSTKEFSTNEPTCMHGQFHVRICEGVLDPVTVTALVLDSGDEQMVWISCDVEHIADITSKLIREKIKKLAPEVDADRVVMNATHTHCTTDINLTGMARYEVDFPVDSSIKLMIPERRRTSSRKRRRRPSRRRGRRARKAASHGDMVMPSSLTAARHGISMICPNGPGRAARSAWR